MPRVKKSATKYQVLLHEAQRNFLDCTATYRGFTGGRGAGKALAVDTLLPTPNGWTKMGDVRIGDELFDEHGNACRVVGTTEVMYGRPCYEVSFSDGTSIVADAEHEWLTLDRGEQAKVNDISQWRSHAKIWTTQELVGQRDFESHAIPVTDAVRYIVSVKKVASVPVRCVEVDSASHLYLAGPGMVPTHNSFIGAYDMLMRACCKENRLFMVAAPTYKLLTTSSFRTFNLLAEQLGKITYKNRSDYTIRLDSGSEILFRSCENPDSLRGPNLSGVWIDEASYTDKAVYDILIACLREGGEQGFLTATFTPKGKHHWTYEVFGMNAPNTALFKSKTSENPFLAETFEGTLRGQYTSSMSLQELEGEFIDAEGSMFRREWFVDSIVPIAPVNARRVRYWDKAATSSGGCYTCGVLMAADSYGIFYIEDVVRGQWGSFERDQVIRATAQADHAKYGHAVRIFMEQEPGSGGVDSLNNSIRQLAGFAVFGERVTGSKRARAEPFAAQCGGHNIKLVRTPLTRWIPDFLDEICLFPGGAFADQVDAASGAFNQLCKGSFSPPAVGGSRGGGGGGGGGVQQTSSVLTSLTGSSTGNPYGGQNGAPARGGLIGAPGGLRLDNGGGGFRPQ